MFTCYNIPVTFEFSAYHRAYCHLVNNGDTSVLSLHASPSKTCSPPFPPTEVLHPAIAFGLLALQHCAFTGLVLRTTLFSDLYDFPTTALFVAEVLRLAASTGLNILSSQDSSPSKTISTALTDVAKLGRVAAPAALLVAKQWFQHSAIQRLGVTQYSIIAQIEIFITAVFVTVLLRRQLGYTLWAPITLVTIASPLTLVPAKWLFNLQQHRLNFLLGGDEFAESLKLIGIVHAVAAAVTSALAFVLLEKILKDGKSNVWITNVQMAVMSGAFIAVSGYAFGGQVAVFESVDKGALRGWDVESGKSLLAMLFVVLFAAGGILHTVMIAVTGKLVLSASPLQIQTDRFLLDNIDRGFATSLGLALMGVASVLFRDWVPSYLSIFGTLSIFGIQYGGASLLQATQQIPVGLPSSSVSPICPLLPKP